MSWKKIIQTCTFLFLLFIPVKALAVEFEISDVKIEAHLQQNGEVIVVEKHTYVLDSEFKGITRDLIAKKGTSITDFVAFENKKELKVKNEQGNYKIYRSGENETIVVDMHYRILNGVERYVDGAQFYWPFFDDENETDYGNMTVEVHPPAEAEDVLYVGYDAAYDKGTIGSGGVVNFSMGEVSAGENGDVRIVYEPDLFPGVVERKGNIREEIMAEEKRLADEKAAFIINAGKTRKYGIVGLSAAGVLFLGVLGQADRIRRRRKKEAVDRLITDGLTVPKEEMSIPATIYYTSSGVLSSEATGAALLDLVRQGNLKQLSDEQFELVNRDVLHAHEKALLELLVDKIGDGVRFDMADLEIYTKDKKNHESYSNALIQWRLGIVEEVKIHHLSERKVGVRWSLAGMGLVLAVAAVQFARYELFGFMGIAVVFTLFVWLFAALYTQRSLAGHVLIEDWKKLRKVMQDIDIEEWEKLSVEDKFRAYTYGIGVKDKVLINHFTQFSAAEKRVMTSASSDSGMYYFNPMHISSSFNSAGTNASVDASGSSTSSSSGGGTGGGGGGSGAF